jgi:hypothetical protein
MTELFSVDLSPTLMLAMWAGGMALATSAVVRWKIVGPGFVWTAVGSTIFVGFATAFRGPLGVVGLVALVLAAGFAKQSSYAVGLLVVSGLSFLAMSLDSLRPVMIVTGALALGGVTSEMLLGHWYLVDPRLPRWALKRLAIAGVSGLVLDAGMVGLGGGIGTGNLTLTSAFGLLSGTSVLLMVGVWYSIKEEGYEGIMAATGLSYLAVLTSLGAIALGRVLLSIAG